MIPGLPRWFAGVVLFVGLAAPAGADGIRLMSFNIRYGTAPDGGEMCACFYRAARFELVDGGTFWLSETPGEVASRGWDAALPRIATWLRLRDRDDGTQLLWLNTHLDHRGERARRESAALLHRWLATHRDGASLVVTGDFNAAANDEPGSVHRTLRLGPGGESAPTPLLVDAWNAVHGAAEPEAGTFNGFGAAPRPGRIDWILVSEELSVSAAAIDTARPGGAWPSDHCPVTATVGLP